jgi:diguanylate cyclase (GGDEF)-like protein/putative nucleotidyltransferase with HDIG domain
MINIIVNDVEEESKLSHVTLAKLPFFDCNVDITSSLQELTTIFKQIPNLPGAVILDGRDCAGMISREKCFETLGRPFGVELYLKRPLSEFVEKNGGDVLILPDKTPIREAVNRALMRKTAELYDPIIVAISRHHQYRLVDMRTLLKAQSDILSTLVVEVEKLSILDPLTGLLNRRGFFTKARKYVDLARKNDSEIAVLMVDIDLFKSVNDIYGHQIGDLVIQSIAQELMQTVRDTDITGRYGGEEFIGMLINVNETEAFAVAERLRQRIESLVIQTEFYNINVTVSIGVCHIRAGATGMESLFSRADKALYEAKTAGRNRVVLWKNFSPYSHPGFRPVILNDAGMANNDQDSSVFDATIESWARALEMRDKETEGHAQRVTTLSVRMAKELGLSAGDCENIRRGALLHDIGKIAIPDSILFKQGKLDPMEWDVMKKHPVYAFNFISPVKILEKVMDIPYCHHEHWDGTGYPRGLAGEAIPLAARIFTLVDVWDALTTDRCYRPAWSKDDALQYFLDQSGLLFDPSLVPVFLGIIQSNGIIVSDPTSQVVDLN